LVYVTIHKIIPGAPKRYVLLTSLHIHTYTSTQAHIHTRTNSYTHTYAYVYTHTYTPILIRTYTSTPSTHTHTYTLKYVLATHMEEKRTKHQPMHSAVTHHQSLFRWILQLFTVRSLLQSVTPIHSQIMYGVRMEVLSPSKVRHHLLLNVSFLL
jgi:hypothetical protein